MCRLVVLALAMVLTAQVSSGGDAGPASGAKPVTVEDLIEQLGARNFKSREAARKALLGRGADVLPKLQKARLHADPEVRRRLDELIPPMERNLALEPKRITLHMTNKPMKDILAEIGKQTGYKIAPWEGQTPGNNKTVYTFHLDNLSFWDALDKISETSGLVLQQNNWGDDSLRLQSADSYVPYSHHNGPFKIVATGFHYSRSNNFGQLPRNPTQPGQHVSESMQFNMNIAVEPKLPIIKVGQVRLTDAVDDEKNSMLPTLDPNSANQFGQRFYYGGWGRSYVHQTQANLLWPSKTARAVRRMAGVIPVTLLADQKPTVVTDKLLSSKGKKYKVGQASFSLEDVSEMPGKQYQMKLSITEENKDNPNDWNRINSLQQRLEIQDDKGNKHSFYFNSINNNGPSSAQFTLTIQPQQAGKIGPPSKLVYFAWVLMEHEVEFEFKDLPLP